MLRNTAKALILLGFLSIIGLAVGWQQLNSWSEKPYLLSDPIEFELARGTSLQQLSTQLQAKGLISDSTKFRYWVRLFKDYHKFQAGLYLFKDQVSPEGIVQQMQAGDIYTPIVVQFTVPEGFTMEQIAARLEANGIGERQALLGLMSNRAFLQSQGINQGGTAEGYLYPATYNYVRVPTPEEAVGDMIQTFWRRLPKDYERDVQKQRSTTSGHWFQKLFGAACAIASQLASMLRLFMASRATTAIFAGVICGMQKTLITLVFIRDCHLHPLAHHP